MDRLAKMHGANKLMKQRLDCSFENKSQTMDRLATIRGQKIVETTVIFAI